MGIMGFGALLLLRCAGWVEGSLWVFGGLMALSALLIVLGRYVEGVVSHAGAYRLLASMRVALFEKIRALAPACLMDRQKGDILNIAVSDIETVEFFFAHTIGPLFTVIILPCVTLGLALWFHPLFAAVLLPVYLVVSVVFPLIAVKAGRGVGLRYRTRLGELKSLVLESVYGLKDIQIFGFGPARLAQVEEKNREINKAAHGLTLHRQTVSSAPTFFVYLARILIIATASYLAVQGSSHPVGTVVLSFVAAASFSSTQSLTMVVSSLLETYAAAERLFQIEDTQPQVTEPAHPKACGPIREICFDQVGFSYGGNPVLRDFSLTLSGREKVGVMGESGVGEIHRAPAAAAVLEPPAGADHHKRHPDPGDFPKRAAPAYRPAGAGDLPHQRHPGGEYRIGEARRYKGGDTRGRPAGWVGGLYRNPAPGLRHPYGGDGRPALWGRAPTGGHRPCAAAEPGCDCDGRAHQQSGCAPRKGAAANAGGSLPGQAAALVSHRSSTSPAAAASSAWNRGGP